MRTRFALVLGSITFAAACAEPGQQVTSTRLPLASANVVAGCTAYTYAELVALVNQVYLAGSPDANAALGRLANLQHQLSIGATATARERAFDLADFTVRKFKAGALVAPESAVIQLLNGIMCYAGLGPYFSTIDNSWIVYPSDLPQTLITEDGWAGLKLPSNPVTEPTVIAITRLADTPSPLVTNLDKYPLNYQFDKSSATDAPFTQDVNVAVCPASGVDPTVRARLKLGHQDDVTGFEVLPPADGSYLDCTNAPSLPSALQAAMDVAVATDSTMDVAALLAVGAPGIGGTTDSFSPLAPVDPRITGSAGVGGTADSFRPGAGTFLNTLACTAVEAPIGSPVADACRPSLTFSTFLGTRLANIPVTFQVEQGGGSIAPAGPAACGTFSTSFTLASNQAGQSTACWTLGAAPGTNTVTARAGQGGDAVPETFIVYTEAGVDDASAQLVRFTATANPPSALGFLIQPASGQQVVAGTSFAATVEVRDRNGERVIGYNGPVQLSLSANQFAVGTVTTVNAVSGVATFSNLVITTAGTTSLVASATFPGGAASTTGNTFEVMPASPVTMTKVAGDNQVAPAGSAVPILPQVRVTDTYGNVVPGVTVEFAAQNNAAAVTGGTQVTSSAGLATVGSWTLLANTNTLVAYLSSNPFVFVTFTATGTTTLSVVNSCALGGSGDPLSYPFVIPGARDVSQVEMYLQSNGSASLPKTYTIALDARLNSFGNPVVATATVPVVLTGRNSQALPVIFQFATPIAARSSDRIAFNFRILGNPDGATLSYNTGPCGLGQCRAPRGCSVTQVEGLTPLPLSTTRRQSVALKVYTR